MGEIPLPQSLINQAEQGASSQAQLDVLHQGDTLYSELKTTVVAMGGS